MIERRYFYSATDPESGGTAQGLVSTRTWRPAPQIALDAATARAAEELGVPPNSLLLEAFNRV
ncbi:MAG: hypothetical protein Q8Q28_15450 [Pseudomonadota bacterium]|nr:hypothetical protein [Pseudomonadota bacterium]